MKKIITLLDNPIPFLNQVFNYLEEKGVNVTNYQLDHICYRVETVERYLQLKKELSQLGELLGESEIGSRPIASFKLNQPIIYKERKIDCVELPAPKEGSFYKEGYEHIEFVINESFDIFMEKNAHLDFLTKDLKKSVNQGVTLKETDFSIKFHHHTLEYVIRYLD